MASSKKTKKTRQKTYSGIEHHKRIGKTLTSPWNTIPNTKPSSWRDERLPEFLWAGILASCIGRDSALATFRSVINYIEKNARDACGKITHTGLSQLDSNNQRDIISIITAVRENKEVLHSLLLFDSLPAREQWEIFLPQDKNIDISPLLYGVAKTLDHQSQQSTDCRWLWLMTFIITGKCINHDREIVEGLFTYPNCKNIEMIRPSIRSMEGGLSLANNNPSDWSAKFWQEALYKTECYHLPSTEQQFNLNPGTSQAHLNEVYQALRRHMSNTLKTTFIDPKYDATFGGAFYCLSILNELLRIGNSTSILARSGLRTILECFVTLKYLSDKNEESLWQSYRVYGAGQTKLSFIKLDELDQSPKYVDKNTLQQIANEDMWLEYLNINLGHWNNSDLRKMSDFAKVKEYYDKYYSWTSSFVHGHWGAVRDTVFETCGNPLHRLHRIPKENPRMLPDVILDACFLTDKILELLSNLYPTFAPRVTVNQ